MVAEVSWPSGPVEVVAPTVGMALPVGEGERECSAKDGEPVEVAVAAGACGVACCGSGSGGGGAGGHLVGPGWCWVAVLPCGTAGSEDVDSCVVCCWNSLQTHKRLSHCSVPSTHTKKGTHSTLTSPLSCIIYPAYLVWACWVDGSGGKHNPCCPCSWDLTSAEMTF